MERITVTLKIERYNELLLAEERANKDRKYRMKFLYSKGGIFEIQSDEEIKNILINELSESKSFLHEIKTTKKFLEEQMDRTKKMSVLEFLRWRKS